MSAPRAPHTIAAFLALTLLSACGPVPIDDSPIQSRGTAKAAPTGKASSGDVAKAKTALAALTIAKPATMTGYSRDKFPHWRSTGGGCDTRDAVLIRDGEDIKKDGCNVTGGTWKSWYDDKTVNTLTTVDIDHMVPLANAWRSGAADWTTEKRSDFANDMDRPQLFAVSASSNRSKGDQSPDQWKPPSQSAWCAYATDWITVKSYWKLTITDTEKAALSDMLGTCA